MITAITLENFKGISERVTIPIRSLTIMFGKNSAGKSTVVQALHYAREIFERGNLNADRTILGGSAVDLGGFRNLVNNHDEDKAITIGFQLDLSSTDLPNYDYSPTLGYKRIQAESWDDFESLELDTLSGRLESVEIELKIEYSELLKRPVLTNYLIRLNKTESVQVITSADEKDVRILYNANHPMIFSGEDSDEPNAAEIVWQQIKVSSYDKTLPDKGEVLILADGTYDEYGDIDDILLTQMLVGTTDLLREWLAGFRYLGPLRSVPPRNFQPALTREESDWADGTAAWTALYESDSYLFDEVRVRLVEDLDTGYDIKLKQFREIPLDSNLMIALANNSVFDDIEDTSKEIKKYPIKKKLVLTEFKTGLEVLPHDIGIGISQVIPVITIAESSKNHLIAIEQPELHLHPAVQAELGDLFIETARHNKNTFLLETHSEHLILRILRRIREHSEGEGVGVPITPKDVQLIFVEPAPNGTIFYDIPVTEEGDFEKNVPGGFFAERAKELF